ncbi:hypothetical protein EPUL_001190, partial [Erysiphe pulchra]
AKIEEWRKNWKPKKDLQLTNSSSNKRPDLPTVVAVAAVSRMSAFIVTQQEDFLNKSKSSLDLIKTSDLPSESSFQVSESVAKPVYDLQDSWILERHFMSDFLPNSSDVLWAGNNLIPIIGYGSTTVKVSSPKYENGCPLKLVVACVPNLHTNVVSLRLLIIAGPQVFAANASDPKVEIRESNEINKGKKIHGNSSKASKVQRGTYDDWHIRMGYLNDAAMQKLEVATKGCEFKTTKPSSQECESCRMVNSKRIISRSPRTRTTRPFWRISWDLIQMNQGSEGEDTLLNTFITFSEYAKRRWGFLIVLVWINDHGYEIETSSPYTQAQNDDAERSGAVLQIRGAELLNIFGLSESLWKEVFPTAGYLLNRSPLRSLGFKTPLGFLKEYVGEPRYVDTFDENDGKPTQEIYGNLNDPRNIIQGKRRRFPKTQFHMEVHDNLNIQAAFHAAFFQGSRHMKSRIHEKDLPPPSENWNQMEIPENRIPETEAKMKPIPVKWVFTYKTDDDGYLLKYKARMVVRGDLQIPSEKVTYAATLAIRVCRAVLAIAIVAYFDLEANRFDVTNNFPHVELDKDDEINIYFPDGFKIKGSLLKVIKALYGLSTSPRLWYNHLVQTLASLGLNKVPESGFNQDPITHAGGKRKRNLYDDLDMESYRKSKILKAMLAILDLVDKTDDMSTESAFLSEYLVSIALTYEDVPIPRSYKDAIRDPVYGKMWKEAIDEELRALVENHTWEEVFIPTGANLISSKWVFTVKLKPDGPLDRFKARLVARGFT